MNVRVTNKEAAYDIELDYSSLQEGETSSGNVCPVCKGGRSREGSLSVSRKDGRLLWICHRAGCGFKGAFGPRDLIVPEPKRAASLKLPRAVGTAQIPEHCLSFIDRTWAISQRLAEKAGLLWTYDTKDPEGRLYIPVFNRAGVRTGFVLRSLTGAKPKSISFTQGSDMAWYNRTPTEQLVIVEDPFSAIRLSKYTSSVALIGTHLNRTRVFELLASRPTKMHLWLDADAFDKAVKYAIQYKCFSVCKLEKDVKNLSEPELIQLLTKEGIPV